MPKGKSKSKKTKAASHPIKIKPKAKKPAPRPVNKKKTKNYTDPRRVAKILGHLDDTYPRAECALTHHNPFQLTVATILSAQCTDQRVNKVTPGLFQKYPRVEDFAALRQEVLEREIHSTGFYRNKAKNIIGCAQKLLSDFGGKIPRTMEEMLSLPGVARKTANVVLGTAFGIPTGIVVDTHVFRISRRWKFSTQKTPEKVERDLMELISKERWIDFGHQVIHHGRRLCTARKPLCADCPMESLCDAPDKTV